MLFSHPEYATACKAFATSEARGEKRVLPNEVTVRIFKSNVALYAVIYPATKMPSVMPFWNMAGVGISSRLAESCLNHPEAPKEMQSAAAGELAKGRAHEQVQERIVELLERAPIGPPRIKKVTKDDVYLFTTGMACIYALQNYLSDQFHGVNAIVGFPFHDTYDLFKAFGAGCSFFGRGDEKDLGELAKELQRRKDEDLEPIQAIWTEFPANPLLTSADLKALRRLADDYDSILVVDDTISGFANVDVLGVADVVVSSLTKSFSGYADVMGGCIILNPSSKKYATLKGLVDRFYHNDYFSEDAAVLEHNSRDFLERSKILNENAEHLVNFLQIYVDNPASSLKKVLYPTTNTDRAEYEAFMRPKTADFTPGYGCLFSLEFQKIEATIAFIDSIDVHIGPHLGAHRTLALTYNAALYHKQLEWAAGYGAYAAQVRISVGLENKYELQRKFRAAMEVADAAKDIQDEN